MRLLVCALLLAACSPNVSRCKAKTLFVSVTLEGGAAQADQLLIEVSLDGGSAVPTTLAHKAGAGMGGVEVDFPGGYPTGHSAQVTVTATVAGAIVGMGQVTVTLDGSCAAGSLSIASTAVDLAGVDLAGVDLATPNQPDLRLVDLFGADLTCVPATENCFNGIDDDCDGLVDCADPDCTGGATPKAACVADPGSFAAGVTVSGAASSCPSAWPSETVLQSNLNAGSCAAGSCSCSLTTDTCQSQLLEYAAADTTCTQAILGVLDHAEWGVGCGGPWTIGSGHNYEFSYLGYLGTCTADASGTANKVAPTWGATDRFCAGGTVGAGCAGGTICVPAGPNHCVMKAGTQLACPANYTLRPIHYYEGFDDSGRSCDCACNLATDGACEGTPTLALSSIATCNSVAKAGLTDGACNTDDISADHYDELDGVSVSTSATCTPPGTTAAGSTTPTGEQTVCCTN